jgi:basic amino acid/polyamine antiporter, APA family
MIDIAADKARPVGSGFSRPISTWIAFLLGLHCISLSSSGIIPFSWVASVWPGANIAWVLTIAMLFCLIHACAYAIIGTVVDKEGSDYVFASRVLSPYLAFAASWTLVIFSAIVAGGLAAWVPTTALPSLLRPMAIILQDPRFADLSDFVSSPFGVLAFGGAIIVIAAITTVQANALLRSFLTVGFIFGALAWIIILWSLLSADGPETFRSAWDHFMGPTGPYGAFDKRIPLAEAAGMTISHSVWQMTLAGLIMGFWIYYGYYIPTFFAEEVQNPRKSLIVAAIGSLVFAWLLFLFATILLERLTPTEWIAAEGYLENNKDAVTAVAGGNRVVAMPWITFYAAILKPEPVLIYLVIFGWLLTLVNLVQTYMFYTSRIIVSWSRDRIVPDWVSGAFSQNSFRRPILITAALAGLGLLDAATGGLLGTQLKFAFFAVVTGIVPIIALTFLPKLHPEIFNKLPNISKYRILTLPIACYVGFVTLVYLIWMVVALFLYPAAGLDNPIATVSILALLVVSGLVLFFAMRTYRLKRGVNIDQNYRTLGPQDPADQDGVTFE